MDGCIVKAPCGGQVAGRSSVDRGKQGTERSLAVEGHGMPIGVVIAPANRHDSPLLAPTLETGLGRFGFDTPRAHHHPPGSGYDSAATRRLLEVLGCDHVISRKGEPLQAGARWLVERTNSWHNRGFKKLAVCTQRSTAVLQAYIALANTIILIRSLIRSSWTSHRWPTRPTRKP